MFVSMYSIDANQAKPRGLREHREVTHSVLV